MPPEHAGVCACDCVFVDLGVKNGNTLLTWWGGERRGGKRQPLGAMLPLATATRLRACAAASATARRCVYGVEANPRWDATLQGQERRARQHGLRVKIFTGTAIDTVDGETSFFVESRPGPGVDASLESARQVHYKDSTGWHSKPGKELGESYAFRRVTVRTMAAGPFLAGLAATSRFVAVKMDVEGSEYRLLRHLLLTQPSLLCRLDVLAMEWHASRMTAAARLPSNLSAALAWLLSAPGCNVSVVDWH